MFLNQTRFEDPDSEGQEKEFGISSSAIRCMISPKEKSIFGCAMCVGGGGDLPASAVDFCRFTSMEPDYERSQQQVLYYLV